MRDFQSQIIRFWFVDTPPVLWFRNNPAFDHQISALFMGAYDAGVKGAYANWQKSPDGCLAACLLYDQFPRRMFRGTAQAYATDAKAQETAQAAIRQGFDQVLPHERKRFLYLPFMHSEEIAMQEKSLVLFEKMSREDPISYDNAVKHHKTISEFGRFPHRNAALGRVSTEQEIAYIEQYAKENPI